MPRPIREVKRDLMAVWYYRHKIDSNADLIQQLASITEKVTTTLSQVPGGGSGGNGREAALVKKMEMEAALEEELQMLNDSIKRVSMIINSLDDYTERNVLNLRYLNCMKWEAVADRLTYDVSWVHRIHNRALQHLANKQ